MPHDSRPASRFRVIDRRLALGTDDRSRSTLRSMNTRLSALSLAFAAALLSCAPRGPNPADKPAVKRASRSFPAAERLTEIAEKPVPPEDDAERIVDTDTWTLAGPLPDTV